MPWYQIISIIGIPSLLGSIITIVLKHQLDKAEKKRQERENQLEEERKKREKRLEEKENRNEQFLLALLAEQTATGKLTVATAKAVQRIPDAKCNGDMKKALEEAETYQKQKETLLMTLGVQHLTQG